MKKKLLSILLIGVLVIGLTGCGNNNLIQETNNNNNSTENVQKQDNNIRNIKEFLNKINNKNFDDAVSDLNTEKLNSTLKINLPDDEYVNALNHSINDKSGEMKYDLESIAKISKEDLLNEISKMDSQEIIKSRTDIIDLFDDYDFYIVEVESSYNDEKTSYHDVVFINKSDSKIYGFVILDGLISYYYNAVYNKPNQ